MLKNYLKTGIRNLLRSKRYAFINISGLAFGIASCLLISLYVNDELGFDQYHKKADQIYNIVSKLGRPDGSIYKASAIMEARVYSEEVPGIVNYARLRGVGAKIQIEDTYSDLKKVVYADAGLYDMFDFEVKSGALDDRLSTLESLVLTERSAQKYFGKEDAVGKSLKINVDGTFKNFIVTAVIADHPSNSSFDFDMALSWQKLSTTVDEASQYWFIANTTAFVQVEPGFDLLEIEDRMKAVRDAKNPGEGAQAFAREMSSLLIPLKDTHFEASGMSYSNGMKPEGQLKQSYILSGIGIIILMIACFNFANLSIVNSTSRSKEVGVRKTIGALKKQLMTQFLLEAVILSFFAFILGIILAELAMPVFEQFTEKQFTRNIFDNVWLLFGAFFGVVISCLLSVVYPSFILSRLNVDKVFKGASLVKGKQWLTKSIVTFQFLLALIFITVAVAVDRQHQYLVNFEKGYDDRNLIRLSIPYADSETTLARLKARLEADPNVLSVGAVNDFNEASSFKTPNDGKLMIVEGKIDKDYFRTMGFKLVKGNVPKGGKPDGVSQDEAKDILLTESSVHELGLEEPIGKLIGDNRFRIVGVFEDFQLFSATSKMNDAMLSMDRREGESFNINNVYVRYIDTELVNVMAALESVWKELLPYEPFNYRFQDVHNAQLYQQEMRWSLILRYSSLLAIIVSMMGLLGLVGLSATQRKKEVSIRKVLGASILGLTVMLNQGFAKLLVLAIVISVPLAYYVVDTFLQDYINRMDITVSLFLIPMLLTFFIALSTVSTITLRSVKRNPIDDLRYE